MLTSIVWSRLERLLILLHFTTKKYFLFLELQKASGLRVLRRLVERQKSVEESEDTILANPIIMTAGIRKPLLMIDKCKKKPPARLKPLVPLG